MIGSITHLAIMVLLCSRCWRLFVKSHKLFRIIRYGYAFGSLFLFIWAMLGAFGLSLGWSDWNVCNIMVTGWTWIQTMNATLCVWSFVRECTRPWRECA